jgi:hypothetical protein
MPPAVHGHTHRPQKRQTVTHIEHHGAQDVTAIYAIVPPSIPASDSPGPAVSLHGGPSLSLSPMSTLAPSLATAAHETTASHPRAPTHTAISTATSTSNFPRPSAPGFLYPSPVVPPQVYEHTMQRSNEYGPQSLHRSLTHKARHQAPTGANISDRRTGVSAHRSGRGLGDGCDADSLARPHYGNDCSKRTWKRGSGRHATEGSESKGRVVDMAAAAESLGKNPQRGIQSLRQRRRARA